MRPRTAGRAFFRCFAGAALLLRAAASQEPAAPSDEGHGREGKPYNAADYTPEERARIERLFTLVICACPREGFTKTLAGCPDGCSEPQKREVRAAVKAGKTDEEVLAEQVRFYGTKQVLAIPESSLAHLMPFLALGALGVVVILVLSASVRHRTPAAPAGAPAKARGSDPRGNGSQEPAPGSPEEARIADAVERDLEEMDE